VKFLLFGLFVYLLYSILKYRILRPFRQGYANGSRQQHQNRTRNYQRNDPKKEGEVSIDYQPSKGKTNDKGIGEYVDYEEVD
tara:strand:+ start:91 stop:336 length:246 start_codon:yes stop_codon:yes gene_type:complete